MTTSDSDLKRCDVNRACRIMSHDGPTHSRPTRAHLSDGQKGQDRIRLEGPVGTDPKLF